MQTNIPILLSVLASIVAITNAHFVLEIPTSLGYNDADEATAPCDTFDPTNRSGTITNWPIGGYAISVITTHPSVTWDIQAALTNDTTTWRRLVPVLNQTSGVGFFCEPQIPGLASWIGLPAVLQIRQHAPDGINYQVIELILYFLGFADVVHSVLPSNS
jgi:Copper acquisition factor BIM1-like